MRRYFYKRIVLYVVALSILCTNFSYAKVKINGVEVEKPVADPKVVTSENTIISKDRGNLYDPVHGSIPDNEKADYDKVNNYNIDLKTLDLRIRYFSPTYLNIRQSAISGYTMAYYARGGNDTLFYDSLSYTEEIKDLYTEYKHIYQQIESERRNLDKSDPNYAAKYAALSAEIATYKYMYRTAKGTYDSTNKTISSTKTMLGLSKALYNVRHVDDNGQIVFAREAIAKSLTSAILSYLQLSTYVDILENQTNLYYDMYKLYEKNKNLGLATENDVLKGFSTYENAKDTLKKTQTTMRNVKEQIASNLGYSLVDIDKLNFIEPVPDLALISSVDYNVDKVRAYTSNSNYYNIALSDKDRKRPGSTGEEILKKQKDYVSSKVTVEFENVYKKLEASLLEYEGSLYLNTACELNKGGNLRKYESKLVSELEYKGLRLQEYADELQVKVAKYNLINAYNDYYYAALGHLDIS